MTAQRRDVTLFGAIALAFYVLYQCTLVGSLPAWPESWEGLTNPPPSSLRLNFLFDSDPPRVVADAARAAGLKSSRHPLFVLFVRAPTQVLLWTGLSPVRAALSITCIGGALAVAFAFLTFRRWGHGVGASLAWCGLVGLAPALWLLASVPETLGFNALFIVLAFLLVRPEVTDPRRHPIWFLGFVVYAVAAVGTTLPNALYVGASFAASLARRGAGTRESGVALVAFGVSAALLGGALLGLQARLYPEAATQVELDPRRHGTDPFLRLDRGWDPAYAGVELRTFLGDALVARRPSVGVVPTPKGDQQLIQFYRGGTRHRIAVGLVALLFAAAMFLRLRERGRGEPPPPRASPFTLRALASQPAGMALGLIAANLAFHYYYRSSGQPLLYSVHTVFPVAVVLATWTGPLLTRPLIRTLGLVALIAVVVNNAFVALEIRSLMHRPCAQWQPIRTWAWRYSPICARWERDAVIAPAERGAR